MPRKKPKTDKPSGPEAPRPLIIFNPNDEIRLQDMIDNDMVIGSIGSGKTKPEKRGRKSKPTG